MIAVLAFIKKWWRETSLVVLVALLGIQAYNINSLKGKLSKSVLERANDQLTYENRLQQIDLETQQLMNQINQEVAEKERHIHEAWTDKLNNALKENELLETNLASLSRDTDRLLNAIKELNTSGGSNPDYRDSTGGITSTSSGQSSTARDVLEACIREYSSMAQDADRVIRDFRLLNDWKEVILIELKEPEND